MSQTHQLDALISMVNQIADNVPQSAHSVSKADDVASHVQRFWSRDMKLSIIAYAQQGGEQLNPLAREAVAKIVAPAND